MLLSLCRVTAGSDLDWPAFVAMASRAGYDAVDVDMGRALAAGARETLALFNKYRVKPGICPLATEFRLDEATFRADLKKLPDEAQFAVDIGCPRMATWVPPAFETPAGEMRLILRERFTTIARLLADYGIRLGLEYISPWHCRQKGHPCVWQMADMLSLCRECGDNVGLLLDSWHWHHDPDHSTQAIVHAGKDAIVTVHLNDAPDLPPEEIRDNERLLPGEGVIDLAGFISALQQIGYEDAVTLEVFGRLNGLVPEDAARQALLAARAAVGHACGHVLADDNTSS